MLLSPFPDVVTEAHVEGLQAVSEWIRTQSVGSPRALTLTVCVLPGSSTAGLIRPPCPPSPQHR